MELRNETIGACVLECGGHDAAFNRTFNNLTLSGKLAMTKIVRLLPPLLGAEGQGEVRGRVFIFSSKS